MGFLSTASPSLLLGAAVSVLSVQQSPVCLLALYTCTFTSHWLAGSWLVSARHSAALHFKQCLKAGDPRPQLGRRAARLGDVLRRVVMRARLLVLLVASLQSCR